MNDCLFCKIIAHKIPSSKVYEDDYTFAFNDINPQAPVHILLVPKIHFSGIHEVSSDKMPVIKKLFDAVSEIVMQKGLAGKRLSFSYEFWRHSRSDRAAYSYAYSQRTRNGLATGMMLRR